MLTVPCKNLKTEAREESCDNGESGLTALLCLIVDGKAAKKKKSGEEGVGRGGVPKDGPLSNQEASEK